MDFEFATASRIIFGPGRVSEVPSLVQTMGRNAFVITGSSVERVRPLLSSLEQVGINCAAFPVATEPTTVLVQEGTEKARETGCDVVIGIGGGSVMDTAKVIAALLANAGDLNDYLEVIGQGKQFSRPAVPCIVIPTTAGTGTEVTRNSVLSSPEHKVKVSVRSPYLLPRLAVIDPELTYSAPPKVTAYSGLDALTQLIEVYVSNKANPLTDGICREGLRRAGRSLRAACQDGTDRNARENMAIAALFSGLGLANAKLGAVHGFAGPLGGMYSAPHGAVCARLLPFVMEVNVRALKERASGSPALARYDEVAQILTGDPSANAARGVNFVQELCQLLSVEPLSVHGLTEGDFQEAVTKAKRASSMKGNPITLTDEELFEIVEGAHG